MKTTQGIAKNLIAARYFEMTPEDRPQVSHTTMISALIECCASCDLHLDTLPNQDDLSEGALEKLASRAVDTVLKGVQCFPISADAFAASQAIMGR